MQALSEDLLDGAAAAAAYIGLKPRTIYRLAEINEIPVIRKGGKLFFRKSELDKAFASGATDVPSQI
ncbi:helix-turn-helix domain-containing protein [Qipengyuania pacifica]|uniref:helix-turn-helix domain-containing protein n=1 Tax=Qipengyuania pacifica TaxID=2860199 RepID=UPI001C9E0370|nr:helix-turn-helix domain-containing protein [Qipengyuania pacifica]MBY8335185.1 helix-turn-helix domain-containing protein [Qipengyuania pacifica]